jgi:hypothetical protein
MVCNLQNYLACHKRLLFDLCVENLYDFSA